MQEALIGLVASLIGAVIGTFGTIWVTHKQLYIAFEKTKLDTLLLQVEKLESLASQISQLSTGIKGQINTEEYISKHTDYFLAKVSILKPYFHYLPKEICEEIFSLSGKLNNYIAQAKLGHIIDDLEARQDYERMTDMNLTIDDVIHMRLNAWQEEIEYLISRKRRKNSKNSKSR